MQPPTSSNARLSSTAQLSVPRQLRWQTAGTARPLTHIPLLQSSSSSRQCSGLVKIHSSRSIVKATPGQDQQQQADAQAGIQQQQQQPGSLLQQAFKDPPAWSAFAGTLVQQGALLGPILDGIHSRVGLQVYDLYPFTLGNLKTSLWVPPLLGTFYIVLGLLTVAADNLRPSPATAAAQERASNPSSVAFLAANFGALAAALALSASLYESQQPPNVIFVALAAVTVANWALFDRTQQGIALAALCGLGAPAAEVVLMALTHCWHYPRADVAGVFVSWVPWCYAFYTPAVSNLARYLWATCRPPPEYEGRS